MRKLLLPGPLTGTPWYEGLGTRLVNGAVDCTVGCVYQGWIQGVRGEGGGGSYWGCNPPNGFRPGDIKTSAQNNAYHIPNYERIYMLLPLSDDSSPLYTKLQCLPTKNYHLFVKSISSSKLLNNTTIILIISYFTFLFLLLKFSFNGFLKWMK